MLPCSESYVRSAVQQQPSKTVRDGEMVENLIYQVCWFQKMFRQYVVKEERSTQRGGPSLSSPEKSLLRSLPVAGRVLGYLKVQQALPLLL